MTDTQTSQAVGTPFEIAGETFVIPWTLFAPPVGHFSINSMLIRGAEPVIVDTGSPANRTAWLEGVFSLVDPNDVRWIFLSHDDRDHAGNLMAVLDACPNATLLPNWFSIGRMADEWMTPLDRCRFLNDGEQLDIGDRTIAAIRPPLFDSPTTRGLFDGRTGAFWAVDTFASAVPEPMNWVHDLDDATFDDGQRLGARLIAPWHTWLDERRFAEHVTSVRNLPIEVIASCHAPVMTGSRIDRAFELLGELAGAPPWSPFTQADLEVWLSMMATATSEPIPA